MNYFVKVFLSIAEGSLLTLTLFACTLVLSLPLGVLVAMVNLSANKPVRAILKLYILLMRGTPLMLQILFVYFGVPVISKYLSAFALARYGLVIPVYIPEPFPAALIAFGLNYAAYFAEIVRGGIHSISAGQMESARALGFSYQKAMWLVVLPQALVNVLPSVGNETTTLVKDTSLIWCIAMEDLLRKATLTVQRDMTLSPFVIAAGFYLVMIIVVTWLFDLIEKKLQFKH